MTDLIPIHRLNTYVGDEIVDALETTLMLKYINHDACKDLPQHQQFLSCRLDHDHPSYVLYLQNYYSLYNTG